MPLEDALKACPVVAILRGVRPDEVVAHAEALFEAGVLGAEVPLNSPQPLRSIDHLARAFEGRMVCGAGTVLQPGQVDQVAEAGGQIIVSPNANVAVIRRAVELELCAAPGFATPSEAFMAIEAGARHLKLFPAVTYGPEHVNQLKAVLPPDVVIWAVGGVAAHNLAAWWACGVRAFGIGSGLYRPGQTPRQTLEKARQIVSAAAALREMA
jgi:2-dehydro-3-deoxyphosphogalactonate aldolase